MFSQTRTRIHKRISYSQVVNQDVGVAANTSYYVNFGQQLIQNLDKGGGEIFSLVNYDTLAAARQQVVDGKGNPMREHESACEEAKIE